MKSPNSLTLDFAGNEDVKALLGSLQPGDKYTIEITGTVSAVDDQTFEGTVDEVEAESADEEMGEEGADAESDSEDVGETTEEPESSADVSAKKPVMIAVISRKGAKP